MPEVWIVNIGVFRGDVEIAAHDEITGFFSRDAITEPAIPKKFVFISRRADCLTIRCINREHARVANRRGDHPRLRVDDFVTKRRADLAQLGLRENRHAVVRFLPVTSGVITNRSQSERWKLAVRAFCLL